MKNTAEQEHSPSLAEQIAAIRRAEERLYQMVPYPPHSEVRALHAIRSSLERMEKLETLANAVRRHANDATMSLEIEQEMWAALDALDEPETQP